MISQEGEKERHLFLFISRWRMDAIRVCEEVLEKLRDACDLPLVSFPIREMGPSGPSKEYAVSQYYRENNLLGFCHMQFNQWSSGVIQQSYPTTVHLVEVKVRDNNSKQFPIEVILPTFIHELAHTVTPAERVWNEEKNKYERLDSHGNSFYHNFACLLRTAESLGIFELPPGPNKFSKKSLKRYDALDIITAPKGFVGSTKLYNSTSADAPRTLRITAKYQGTEKLIIIESSATLDDFLLESRKKFRTKFSKVFRSDGSEVFSGPLHQCIC
eukprot:CAMPEP_0206210534 /NCGR_PEP_ID=MMETSP0166-20121206/17596_1 /ASSEMBLY_ACC=CAM_ASM_000260 /TAXON_ID=95228 /ORGANISM="Vannella robusta, Strain DIVA3 518/3/11/1/6" /LENGTH=271 /DNA_ID=CAMNT_0053632209 /DNA_START=116 /DNA_END=929 /DNA_ORIENTATION=-